MPNLQPYFTSTAGRPLIEVVSGFLSILDGLDQKERIEVQIMVFSFTDAGLADHLKALAKRNPMIRFRILGDWGNVVSGDGRQLHRIANSGISNIEISLKYDEPYEWNPETQKVVWSYHASLGMLHHKTICIIRDGKPFELLTGSFNWTKKGGAGYENILTISATEETNTLLADFQREFEAIWQDHNLAMDFPIARKHYALTRKILRSSPNMDPHEYWKGRLQANPKTEEKPPPKSLLTDKHLVAFSGSYPYRNRRKYGFSVVNANKYFYMRKYGGKQKRVPVELHTLALDLIFAAKKGSLLRLAMFALSYRSPEYVALLQAARKGVKIRMIFDKAANNGVFEKLKILVSEEGLPLECRMGKRSMHQKYLVDLEEGNLITGTANMTIDASERHAEHRFLFRNDHRLAVLYAEDFDTIWSRISREGI